VLDRLDVVAFGALDLVQGLFRQEAALRLRLGGARAGPERERRGDREEQDGGRGQESPPGGGREEGAPPLGPPGLLGERGGDARPQLRALPLPAQVAGGGGQLFVGGVVLHCVLPRTSPRADCSARLASKRSAFDVPSGMSRISAISRCRNPSTS